MMSNEPKSGGSIPKETPSEPEMRANVIRLGFGGDEFLFKEFCAIVRAAVPEANAAVLRGSSITGYRWKDGAQFDSDGPGTSDLDLTLVGSEVLKYYSLTGYWVPGTPHAPVMMIRT